ncbi:MAG: hypothetical protein AAF844_01215 [Pseudomonadota bacterium]
MYWPRTPERPAAAALLVALTAFAAAGGSAADRTFAPGFAFDPCSIGPSEYRRTVALALDGRWVAMPDAGEDGAPPAAPLDALIIEVGPWGLRALTREEASPVPLFFEQGEVWDFDPPPWMPRPDPASRVSENHRLDIALPCPQHRLPRLYGAGRVGDDETTELFLTVIAPDRLAGRVITRTEAESTRSTFVLERYSSSP